MYCISLEQMEFWANHGCFAEERTIGNRFTADLYLDVASDIPCQSDKLEDALDYQCAYRLVQREMMLPSHLLEHVATRILDALETELPGWSRARLVLRKHNPPLGGKLACSAVTLTREK